MRIMSDAFAREDVERLARLARLRLTPEELDRFAAQLARGLNFAKAVQQVSTTDIPPTSHPLADVAGHAREDTNAASLPRADVLSAAPDADAAAGLFKVPRVLG
jgi:aspartyl-tRNA(Asn)/glutamyl-tRNA(Gln) amidotransferase subunit C